MVQYFLYRLKAIREQQGTLFQQDITKRKFIIELLTKKPSHELRKGYNWHIGNLRRINEDGVLFAVGRTTFTNRETYNQETGDFLEINDEDSPFTHAIYDEQYSVLAIAPKSRLAPTTKGIARNIEKLLNADPFTKDNEMRIEVSQIPEPSGFISQLQTAYAVVSFRMQFGEPNPFDVEKDFHSPMEKLLKETAGNKGATKISGKDLNRESLETLSRSVASVGNDASARIRTSKDSRLITKHLKGNPANFTSNGVDGLENRTGIFQQLRQMYQNIRGTREDS